MVGRGNFSPLFFVPNCGTVGFELFFRLFGSYWEVQQAFKRAVL